MASEAFGVGHSRSVSTVEARDPRAKFEFEAGESGFEFISGQAMSFLTKSGSRQGVTVLLGCLALRQTVLEPVVKS